MIAIVSYGSGNVRALANVYRALDVPHVLATTPEHIEQADRIVLPGVGAFDQVMNELMRCGLLEPLAAAALQKQKPVLGICVGMQILAKSSAEGKSPGLGWLDATVERIESADVLPHMGWNAIERVQDDPLFQAVDLKRGYYFLHGYYVRCVDDRHVLATATYGHSFACAVRKKNVWGVQFHPEKSHGNGIALLRNFAVQVI